MKLFSILLVLAAACGNKSDAPNKSPEGAAPAAADDQKSICAEVKAERIKGGATPRDSFETHCMAAPKKVVECQRRAYYEAHKDDCTTALKAYPDAIEIR